MDLEFKDARTIINNINIEEIKDHPNILIAAKFWDESRYQAAKTCYIFMRKIDDLIDNRKAKAKVIDCLERQLLTDQVKGWIDCLINKKQDGNLADVVKTVRKFKIPLKLFHNFASSMIYDINHEGFDTLDDFINYSNGASVAPASVFVHLCSLKEINGSYQIPDIDVIEAAKPCAMFSYLVHIIRDFQKDQLNNLNYFALDKLRKHSLTPEDLKNMANGQPIDNRFRNMISEYMQLADQYRKGTEDAIRYLTPLLSPRYMLSLHIIFNLYLQVYERIDVENGNFTTTELNPQIDEVKERVEKVISDFQLGQL